MIPCHKHNPQYILLQNFGGIFFSTKIATNQVYDLTPRHNQNPNQKAKKAISNMTSFSTSHNLLIEIAGKHIFLIDSGNHTVQST